MHDDLCPINHSNEGKLPHLITADISRHQFPHAVTYSKGDVGSPQVSFCCCASASEANMAATLEDLFPPTQYINCDILIGRSCSVDWQPGALYKYHLHTTCIPPPLLVLLVNTTLI